MPTTAVRSTNPRENTEEHEVFGFLTGPYENLESHDRCDRMIKQKEMRLTELLVMIKNLKVTPPAGTLTELMMPIQRIEKLLVDNSARAIKRHKTN